MEEDNERVQTEQEFLAAMGEIPEDRNVLQENPIISAQIGRDSFSLNEEAFGPCEFNVDLFGDLFAARPNVERAEILQQPEEELILPPPPLPQLEMEVEPNPAIVDDPLLNLIQNRPANPNIQIISNVAIPSTSAFPPLDPEIFRVFVPETPDLRPIPLVIRPPVIPVESRAREIPVRNPDPEIPVRNPEIPPPIVELPPPVENVELEIPQIPIDPVVPVVQPQPVVQPRRAPRRRQVRPNPELNEETLPLHRLRRTTRRVRRAGPAQVM